MASHIGISAPGIASTVVDLSECPPPKTAALSIPDADIPIWEVISTMEEIYRESDSCLNQEFSIGSLSVLEYKVE